MCSRLAAWAWGVLLFVSVSPTLSALDQASDAGFRRVGATSSLELWFDDRTLALLEEYRRTHPQDTQTIRIE